MGIQNSTSSDLINMKAFIALSALLAVATADVSSHSTVKHGHGPVISHAVHQPHHGPAIVHAPVVAHPAAVHPVVAHKVPVVAHPAPYHAPAPAPYHVPAPAPYHAPAPVHHAAAYKEPAYDAPAVYGYEYAVADDYSKANFGANEARDGYKTSGSYRVALPDGRTQVVNYHVDDAYSGYVADVSYEGHAAYPPAPVHKAAYKPAPVYHAAQVKPVHA